MTEMIDFNLMEKSTRHGTYAGQAGNKDGIIYKNEPWIIKYPRSAKFMQTEGVSYVSSPLSEYIGSHIYDILGIPVHDTLLGIRQNKVVVACKDFRADDQLASYLNAMDLAERLTGGRTAYEYDGKLLSAKKLLKLPIQDLQHALLRIVPRIERNMDKMQTFIRKIPGEYKGYAVCSDVRKEYYTRGIRARYDQLLKPAYQKLKA